MKITNNSWELNECVGKNILNVYWNELSTLLHESEINAFKKYSEETGIVSAVDQELINVFGLGSFLLNINFLHVQYINNNQSCYHGEKIYKDTFLQ